MQRKVKFFDKLYDTDTLDEEIEERIRKQNHEIQNYRLLRRYG